MDGRIRTLRKISSMRNRVKKNVKYQASALPFPSWCQQQYESRPCIMMGPEWTSETTLQDSTMPRAMVRQGTIIEPIYICTVQVIEFCWLIDGFIV
ncbi:Utp14 protein-domain-containing protein [Tuber brumale]|nr:Utp14 protein-domain-containing protein [Tuber brumale]